MKRISWSRAGGAAVAGVLVSLLLASVASAEPTSVVLYSYTRVMLGNDAQYVLAPTAGQMKLEPSAPISPAAINGVFNELRSRKSATYGSSSVEVTPASLKKGSATVKIDPSKQKYAPIIMGEVVYTLTQLGLESVDFPTEKQKGVTRADVPFGAFALVMPAWRALPPNRIAPAELLLPDGSEIKAEDFYKRLDKGDEAMIKALQTWLGSDNEQVVLTVARSVSQMKLGQKNELLLPLLKHKEPRVRQAGLESLAGQEDVPVLDAISAVMDKDKDKEVAQQAASILGKSQNKLYSVRAQFFALRGGDEASALEAVKALAASKEPTAAPELVKAARGGNQKVALAAIDALADLKQAQELEKLFQDGKLEMERRLRASSGALRMADDGVRFNAMAFQARNAPGSAASSALETLAKVKDPDPRDAIEAALEHPEAPVRHTAARLLAERKNPASLKALAAAGARPEDEEVIEEAASAIMGELSLNDVLNYTGDKNAVLQRVAYRALGQKAGSGNARVFGALEKGVTNKDTGIRASSVLALGAFKNDKALGLVVSAGKDPEARVRRNVARSLSNWEATTHSDLLYEYLQDQNGEVVEAAISTFDARQEFEAYKKILSVFRGKPEFAGTRAAALKAIVKLAPKKELQTVISTVGGGLFDKDRDVKLLAIKLLGRYDNPAAVTTLAALINDPVEEYRIKSLLALGDTGSKEAIELIVSVLGDQSQPVRVAAMEALGRIGLKSASEPIRMQLAVEKDKEVIKTGQDALKKLK